MAQITAGVISSGSTNTPPRPVTGREDGAMNHKPALDWLFEDPDDLTAAQSEALQEHLAECTDCQQLSESYRDLTLALIRSGQVGPEAGFAERWRLRLEVSRAQAHRRQIIATLAFNVGGLVVL